MRELKFFLKQILHFFFLEQKTLMQQRRARISKMALHSVSQFGCTRIGLQKAAVATLYHKLGSV